MKPMYLASILALAGLSISATSRTFHCDGWIFERYLHGSGNGKISVTLILEDQGPTHSPQYAPRNSVRYDFRVGTRFGKGEVIAKGTKPGQISPNGISIEYKNDRDVDCSFNMTVGGNDTGGSWYVANSYRAAFDECWEVTR